MKSKSTRRLPPAAMQTEDDVIGFVTPIPIPKARRPFTGPEVIIPRPPRPNEGISPLRFLALVNQAGG